MVNSHVNYSTTKITDEPLSKSHYLFPRNNADGHRNVMIPTIKFSESPVYLTQNIQTVALTMLAKGCLQSQSTKWQAAEGHAMGLPRDEKARPSKRPHARQPRARAPRCNSASPSPSWCGLECPRPGLPSAPAQTCPPPPLFSETYLPPNKLIPKAQNPTESFRQIPAASAPILRHCKGRNQRTKIRNWEDKQIKKRKIQSFPPEEAKNRYARSFNPSTATANAYGRWHNHHRSRKMRGDGKAGRRTGQFAEQGRRDGRDEMAESMTDGRTEMGARTDGMRKQQVSPKKKKKRRRRQWRFSTGMEVAAPPFRPYRKPEELAV